MQVCICFPFGIVSILLAQISLTPEKLGGCSWRKGLRSPLATWSSSVLATVDQALQPSAGTGEDSLIHHAERSTVLLISEQVEEKDMFIISFS